MIGPTPMPIGGDRRARLTIPDLVFFLVSIAFLGALWPVAFEMIQRNLGELSVGEILLFRLVLPLSILVLLSLIYLTASEGMGP